MIYMYILLVQMEIGNFPHNIVASILELRLIAILTADQPAWIIAIRLQQHINNFIKINCHLCLLRNRIRPRCTMLAENLSNLFEF